jgi:hypothetical protein
MSTSLKIVVCGGGNGAHVLAGLAAARENVTASVLTLYEDEHTRWKTAVVVKNDLGEDIRGEVATVTNDPAAVIPGADVIAFVVPAFAHKQYLEAIKPYIQPRRGDERVILGALPGEGGFDLCARSVLGSALVDSSIVLFAMETLPWACRLIEYGSYVEVLGTKHTIDIGMVPTPKGDDPTCAKALATLQMLMGDLPKLHPVASLLSCTLMNINAVRHAHGRGVI